MTQEMMRGASFAAIEQGMRQRVEQFVETSARQLDPALPALIAFHGSLDGAQLGTERAMTLGQEMVLPCSLLAQPGVAYVAMGHIHKHQLLYHNPPMVYPGSLDRVDFGERDDPKGCVLVTIEHGRAHWEFRPLAARPFVSIEKDVRGSSDPLGQLRTLITRHNLQEAVVRVELRADREQAPLLPEQTIRAMLEEAGAFFIAAVSVHVERSERRRLAGVDQELLEGLTPRRALELYLQSKQPPLSPTRIAALLAAADELMQESYPRSIE